MWTRFVCDLIALGYRRPNQFRILLPLIVIKAGEHTRPVSCDPLPTVVSPTHRSPPALLSVWV